VNPYIYCPSPLPPPPLPMIAKSRFTETGVAFLPMEFYANTEYSYSIVSTSNSGLSPGELLLATAIATPNQNLNISQIDVVVNLGVVHGCGYGNKKGGCGNCDDGNPTFVARIIYQTSGDTEPSLHVAKSDLKKSNGGPVLYLPVKIPAQLPSDIKYMQITVDQIY
jgi:hypothetical protein